MTDILSISHFAQGDQVLLYDRKYQKHPGKLQMHWLGPFIVVEIHESGVVRITQIDGILHHRWVNGTHLKPYILFNKCNCAVLLYAGVHTVGRIFH
jgi:hypothetical protein